MELQVQSEKPDFDKVWLMFQETNRQFHETKELISKSSIETEKKFQETDKKFQDTDKKLNKLEYLFTSQWGRLIESLVEGDLVNLLNKRNINVNCTTTRTKLFYQDREFEFDIIAENGIDVVFVEVKTNLKVADVKEFLEELKMIRTLFPKYNNYNIFGAVAYLVADENSSVLASRKGLFTIKATGNSASITNGTNFKPRNF
ncbi:MAG: hypothetical protein QG635_1244 [Bacteroidota bacterium]|nr:hypothetical protein [Bacteroidota bacterium]